MFELLGIPYSEELKCYIKEEWPMFYKHPYVYCNLVDTIIEDILKYF